MKRLTLSVFFSVVLLLSGCGSPRLLPVNVDSKQSLVGYKYFYITPTGDKSGTTGYVYGNQYGTYGGTSERTTNPGDVISGFLIKKGYVRVPELPGHHPEETIIINYGESGRRSLGRWRGYTLEATIQFISASTSDVLCTVSGEGLGSTEADDIRVAILRCMEEVFGK